LFTRCLVCSTPFQPNEQLEHFPLGERVAYDPGRGRLWAVCKACKRWSLAPIEERWETLEELEKLTRDQAQLLSQTDNIALLRSGPLEIVRVGRANLTEEAWWRYGRELTSRRRRYEKLSLAGTLTAGAVVVGGWASGGVTLLGAWLLLGRGGDALTDAARWLRFGSAAWRGRQTCPKCGHVFDSVRYGTRGSLGLFPGDDPGSVRLVQRCPVCGGYREGGLHLEGAEAERTLRRVLAYHHFSGADERQVFSATRLIQEAGGPQDLTRLVVRDGRVLGDLQRTGAVALEIAANESAEQHLLELELAELEARWLAEEELAAIVDGELTPLPLLETLRLKVTRRK
jgi:hypothetical protein